MTKPVVLSYGLGVDSTAILLRWMLEPGARDFDLSNLTVVTAMTGDEWPETGAHVENHMLPLMREHQVRYIQLARRTGSQTDGVVILDDSRSPARLHLDGHYKLSDEMLAAGTVPQMGGVRKCSQKAKGFPLDKVIESTLGRTTPFRHVVGFEANEPNRAVKDALANTDYRTGEYPLIEWGWDRQRCEDYIFDHLHVEWLKSACVYCPFALSNKAGRQRALMQYRENVKAAVDALFVEHVSLSLNPRQGLNGDVRLRDLITADGNLAALQGLQERLDTTPHAIYEVRRVLRPRNGDPTKLANASRSVRRVTKPEARELAVMRLGWLEGEIEIGRYMARAWQHRRIDTFPSVEHVYVVAPAVVADKTDPKFEGWWREAYQRQFAA